MKKSVLILSIFLLALLVSSFAFKPLSAEAKNFLKDGVAVTGYAEVKTQANKIEIVFGIETLEETLAEAEEKVWQKAQSLKEKIENETFDNPTMLTQSFYAHKHYSYENGKQNFLGYMAVANFSVTISNFQNLQPLISTISQEATNFNNLRFYKDNTNELYTQALFEAFQNAKEKAESLSNQKQIYLKSIKEEVSYYGYNTSNFKAVTTEGEISNEVTIKAKVTAHFSFDNEKSKNNVILYERNIRENKPENNILKRQKQIQNIIPPKKEPEIISPKTNDIEDDANNKTDISNTQKPNENNLNSNIKNNENIIKESITGENITEENTIEENTIEENVANESILNNNINNNHTENNHSENNHSENNNNENEDVTTPKPLNNMLEKNILNQESNQKDIIKDKANSKNLKNKIEDDTQNRIISNTPFKPVSI